MTKKLFVVLVVIAAMLAMFALVMAAKKPTTTKGPSGTFEKAVLTAKQSATSMPGRTIMEPLEASAVDQSNLTFDGVVRGVPYVPAGPGDMLWCCPVEEGDPLDDQIVGCEAFRDTIYTTGAGGTTFGDTNYVYAWLATGTDVCTFLYRTPQPAHTWPSGWGWRDVACDGEYLYASYSNVLNCFYVTPAGVVEVPANNITGPITPWRAVAYDAGRDAFWTASFSSPIYCVDRSGAIVAGPFANSLPLYGMAYDGTYLWCHSQDNTKVYQFDPNSGTYTGVVYSGCQDATGGIAGGLSMLSSDEGKQVHTLIGVTQGTPDAMYAIEVEAGGGPLGCCDYASTCDMITEDSCTVLGGTWYAAPYECIDDQCQVPTDTICHLQWDNGSASWYASSFVPGDQQGNYFNPETMCPDCGPDVYPFLLSQVSGLWYDYAGNGYVDVIVHIYGIGPDTCTGPGADIYSFATTITTFYPDEAIVPLPEVLCLEEDFVVAFEIVAPQASPACVLWTSEAIQNCIGWIWQGVNSPPWWPMELYWTGVGYHIIRADGVCNSGVCDQGEECNMAQDNGSIASYAGWLMEGFKLAKYYDPEDYCEEPVYPYMIHDVDVVFYDFAGVGEVNIEFGVHLECHDSCDGPGTQIYASDTYNITTFYPTFVHIEFPEPICVFEPFFITATWKPGPSPFPSFLIDNNAGIPGDSCHAWFWYVGDSPPWIEHWDLWGTPAAVGMPIFRVSGFTSHPECEQAPCEDPLELLWGGLYAYYFWKQPPNDEFLNMMFTMPLTNPGRLDAVEFALYSRASQGTPDADIYIWLSDGVFPLDNNPPYQALAEFQIPNAELYYYPTYNYIDCHELGLLFDVGEKFHVGGGHANEPGDTLNWLSDDGAFSSERASGWYEGAWESYFPYEFLINAYVCLYEPPESTFTLECSPFLASVTPGDPPAKKFEVDLGSILGYNLNVALSCTPPAGFTVSFDPPNGIPPFTSDVYVSVAAPYPYDEYTLTFCGTGDDGQIVCCDVKARVEPPYDEVDVPFYHGSQLATNFGAVGNDANNDNFLWYGLTGLQFDGTFIVATDNPVNMALDVYNCVHWGWVPSQHIDCYYDAEYNANICYGNFYCDELEPGIPGVPGEHDSVFIVGIMDECIDFSIKIKVYYNPTQDPIYGMYIALFEDWDIGDAYNNEGNMDPDHNLAYMYDPLDPDLVFGMMKAPYYDDPLFNIRLVPNYQYVWPNSGFCDDAGGFWGLDSLYWLMTQPGYVNFVPPDSDFSILLTAPPIDLLPGDKHIEVWIDFGRNLQDGLSWSQWWHRVLRYAGFYRGDVNASDTLDLPALDVSDLVYLIQYLFQDGPAPLPYADQGDVDGTCCGEDEPFCGSCVNVGDVIYLLNYVFLDGPPPVDYMRFIPQCWPRESLFLNNNWD